MTLIHPDLPHVYVPQTVSLNLENQRRDIPVALADGDVYYKLGQHAFMHEHRGYAAFPLQLRSQEAIDQIGSHTIDLFAFHPGSYLEPQELQDPNASITDMHYMGEGLALGYDIASSAISVYQIGSETQSAEIVSRKGFIITYYARTAKGLGCVSLTRPAFYQGIEKPVTPEDERILHEFWRIDAALRTTPVSG